ncbi:uncharacterized protein A1O9_12752 [Exophiala aquamarina CBS 119918]|uniref:Major facilitator superfamily (MFS) profile domain-containing protein n=1 Tax=Exophiala aquamarina CBS 119918 TaxID=1182545 RepID=A0A072NVS8_9EURO|nr:uncharacterized protein A1O9_12752 [Exophiala aquamarina CBS 119918]KEF51138.1 hypothetical protein A1O9_12752 [Exophiala aquamarina CBS 119918]
MTMSALSFFMLTLLRSMGFSGTNLQLLTVPPYTVSALCCLGVSFLSDRIRSRGLMFSFLTPFVAIVFAILGAMKNTEVRYPAVFLATSGAFTASPILLAWFADNASGPAVRSVCRLCGRSAQVMSVP